MEVADMPKPRRTTSHAQHSGPYTTSVIDTPPGPNPFQTIGDRINPNGPGGCWIWTGPLSEQGYGWSGINLPGPHSGLVHRIVYEILVGPIPEDHDLHHECGVVACCNPDHLTPLTHADHMAHHAELRRAS